MYEQEHMYVVLALAARWVLQVRYVPEDVAAAVVDGLGHEAHQAAAAAAVHKVELPLHLQIKACVVKTRERKTAN